MKAYASIANEETKQCNVGIGTDSEFYESIGMELMDVEEAYDGQWYLEGFAPSKPQSLIEEEIRIKRDSYLLEYVDPIQLVIRWNTLTNDEQVMYTLYRQYLLDIPQDPQFPNIEVLSLEEWKEKNQ